MATRFYFPSTTAAAVTPAVNGTWNATGDTVNRKLIRTTKSDTARAAGTTCAYTDDQSVLDRRYVSDALEAQTISGTVKMQLQGQEGNAADTINARLELYVVSNDGSVVRGTLLAAGHYGLSTDYSSAQVRNVTFADGDTLSSLAVQSGDRLVVAIGAVDVATDSGDVTHTYGDVLAHTDLPENETSTSTTASPWIEFSGTILYDGETAGRAPGSLSMMGIGI